MAPRLSGRPTPAAARAGAGAAKPATTAAKTEAQAAQGGTTAHGGAGAGAHSQAGAIAVWDRRPIRSAFGSASPSSGARGGTRTAIFPQLLKEDELLRKYLKARVGHAAIADIHIERKPGKVVVTIHTGRPGVVIGKKGAEVDKLRDELTQLVGKEVGINVEEIKRPELDAQLVADNVANQLAQRISFRRAMKRAVQSAMRMGAQGIKIKCGGRLGGAEIARVEGYHEGRVPLHTLRADIDYATSTAKTTFGTIGVKVWIFKGEIVEDRRGKTYSTGS